MDLYIHGPVDLDHMPVMFNGDGLKRMERRHVISQGIRKPDGILALPGERFSAGVRKGELGVSHETFAGIVVVKPVDNDLSSDRIRVGSFFSGTLGGEHLPHVNGFLVHETAGSVGLVVTADTGGRHTACQRETGHCHHNGRSE